ncbi:MULTISPECIES: aminotransferase class III-fold pyridoxal phosphate-dependent enzyme [Klebsiella/Raoultella group]|uniref:aminotransferase class III-fold pyridoxal phosphate-dependent enzyme n=1 Tax=Klebsiella/Raoultella group TaxID=2890311 RepID=UPI001C608DAE|nr:MULTISPECIES: aminotransferase class III-fold pyridoxal phosphate-dependent enzyme [Klebsiella/Raoultella group]
MSGTYGVEPDLVTAGKLIGVDFPVGAIVGREEIMRDFDPTGQNSLPHAGTFSGNPVSMAAGAEALRLLTPAEISRINLLGENAIKALSARITGLG